ncbi:unnamed protein product [Leptosia nina]|uniref:Uncharacterized protein n=1 Tax=Leptosia nina TaxID=320188 RepID=A0AAV1JJC6_9NEOP
MRRRRFRFTWIARTSHGQQNTVPLHRSRTDASRTPSDPSPFPFTGRWNVCARISDSKDTKERREKGEKRQERKAEKDSWNTMNLEGISENGEGPSGAL